MSPDVITLSQLDQPSVTDENADWYYDVELTSGVEAANLYIAVQTHDIPEGCQVWFHNLDGEITIAVPPTVVMTQPDFQVGTTVQLPANYTCTIRVFLQLNDHVPPPDARMQLVVQVVASDGKVPTSSEGQPSGLLSTVTLRP